MSIPTVSLNAGIITGIVVNRSQVTLMARVLGQIGLPINQSTVLSLAWKVVDLTAGTVVATGTFGVNATVFNSLQQGDPRWTRDNVKAPGPDGQSGYNFLGTLPASTFPATALTGRANLTPPDKLHCDVTFTMGDSIQSQMVAPYEWTPIAAY